jgi:hypothetical protein
MKFSKSILIFLLISSFSGVFIWAMLKTNGNLLKSLQFTFIVLAFKMGLIGINNLLESNQSDSNRQLVNSVNKVEPPRYHPYLSVYNDYRPSGLYMSNIERPSLVPQHYHSQKLINELRAGDSRVTQAAWLLIIIWILQHQSVGFQPVRQAPMAPHMESARNLLFGKPKPDQFSCRRLSMFGSQQFENQNVNTNHFKKLPNYSETVKFNDGYKAEAGNVQLDHILVKHCHQWGIDDTDLKNIRDANNNLSPNKPEQIRTRLTPDNREKLRTVIQEMASSSKLESYPNYPISEDMGRAYLCPDTGLFIGIDKNNVIRKAYVASENLINYLRTNCT